MTTSEESQQGLLLPLPSSAEDSRARMSAWQAAARAWLESGADSGSSFTEFLQSLSRLGLSSKMSPASCRRTEDGIWEPFSGGWATSGIGGPTGCLTLSGSEWPNAAVACSLSDILETDVPQKFYLSPRACAGILRRAERRGKALPPMLHQALRAAVEELQGPVSQEDKTRSSLPGAGETEEAPTKSSSQG